MACDGKTHNLIDILRTPRPYGIDSVVRWCSDCGAVVIDLDVDNRTAPGNIMKMRFPRMTYPNQS